MNGRSSPMEPTPNIYKTKGVQKLPRQSSRLVTQDPPTH